MNLPNIPTDNLYKFIALSGLVLTLFSLIFPWTRMGEIRPKLVEINTQLEILKIESDEIEKELSRLEKMVNPTPEELTAIIKERKEHRIKNAELKGRFNQVDALVEELFYQWRFLKFGVFVGFIISFIGFWFWYHFVQKPNDMLLKKQIENNKKLEDISR